MTTTLAAVSSRPALRFGADRFEAQAPMVVSRTEGPLHTLTLNRLGAGNRLNQDMFEALEAAFRQAEADPKIQTIVLESAHEKYFSPGVDVAALLKEAGALEARLKPRFAFLPKPIRQAAVGFSQYLLLRRTARAGVSLMHRIAGSPKVTVAKINGLTLGAGLEMALACDYIIAAHHARFALPEVKYGIFPDLGGTERLPQRVGPSLAKFIILEGGLMAERGADGPATLTAAEAERIGMIDDAAIGPMLNLILLQGMRDGRFLKKPARPRTREEIGKLDEMAERKTKGTRLFAKFNRYRTASLDELTRHELKPLYAPTLALALRRIENAPDVDRLTEERDVFTMIRYIPKAMKKLSSDS